MEGVQRHLSLVAKTQTAPSWCHGRLVSGYSLPPPAPPTLSRIVDQMARPRAAGDGRECPLICCVMGPVNSCWTCSDARNIGRYNRSRYDSIRYTQYRLRCDTDPIIVRSLIFAAISFYLRLICVIIFSKSERKNTAEGIKCLKAFINNRVSVVLHW